MNATAVLAIKIIGDATGGIDAFRKTDTQATGLIGKFGKVGPAALAIGGAVVTGAAVAGTALYGIGSTWDEVSDAIRVGTGTTGQALEGLVQSAKNIAGEIPAAIGDVGTTVADLNTRLGLTGPTLETVAKQYLEAGRMLGETIDIEKTSAAFNLFGLEGEAVVGGMDDLFRVSQATGVGMNDLAAVVTKAGPGLTNLGFSFAESAALAGSLDKAGIDAGATLGAMQKGLVTLAKAGEEPQAAFQRVVGEIQGFVNTGNDAAALDLASQVFGTKGAAQFVTAIQSGTLGVEDLMGAAGTTSDSITGLGAETMDAAEKWAILQNKAMVALEPIAGQIFDGAGAALDWLLNLVETTDWTPFQEGVAVAMEALDGLWPLLEQAGALIAQLMPVVQQTFEGIMGILGPALDIITNVIKTVLAVIQGDWSGAWEGIKGIVSGVVALIKGLIANWLGQLKGLLESLNLGDIFTRAWNAGKQAISTGITGAVAFFQELPGKIVSALSSLSGRLTTIGSQMIQGLINGVKNMASRVVSSVQGVINDAISGAKRLLGIRSPSRVFAGIGTQTGQGLVNGLLGQASAVAAASDAMVGAAIPSNIPDIDAPGINLDTNSRGRTGTLININVTGALDPRSVARQIRQLLNDDARVRGVVDLAGAVIA